MGTGANGTRRHRVGDWVCSTHDVIRPDTSGPVPLCPECGRMVLRVRRSERGWLEYVEPAPSHCDGPDRHELGPRQVLVGWGACTCPDGAHTGHRSWRCQRCPSTIFVGTPK